MIIVVQILVTLSTVNLFPASLKLGITINLNLLCNVVTWSLMSLIIIVYVNDEPVYVLDKENLCFLKNMLCDCLLFAE